MASISLPPGFQIVPVNPGNEVPQAPGDEAPGDAPGILPPAPQTALLGVLSNFAGKTFTGTGLNTIFRPNNGKTPTTFPKPVNPPPPAVPNDAVLELNLTKETLSFTPGLGNIPNRGFGQQGDIELNGVSYTQSIDDVTNPVTGRGDGPPRNIHFETGIWLNVPATSTNPVLNGSLVRMASIPHGTTINATTAVAPKKTNGPPTIPSASIRPFRIGASPSSTDIPVFPSQNAANGVTSRLPQDLSAFIATKQIDQDVLNDPNLVLRRAIANQKIVSTTEITVSTTAVPPNVGGGTDNIAFLVGNNNNPNANATLMTSTFWFEIVAHTITIPVFQPGQRPLMIPAPSTDPKIRGPTFQIDPGRPITKPITITLNSLQVQYSQMVFLDFGGLTWPHASVATLRPTQPIIIPKTTLDQVLPPANQS